MDADTGTVGQAQVSTTTPSPKPSTSKKSKVHGYKEVDLPERRRRFSPEFRVEGGHAYVRNTWSDRAGSRMKVALLAPVAWRTPPRHYGSREKITSQLAEGLSSVEWTSPCSRRWDSRTAGALEGVCPHGYAEDPVLDGAWVRRCTWRTR